MPVALAIFALLFVLFVILPLVGWALWFALTTAIVGVIMGGLGRLIVPGTQRIGALATIGCGIAGATVGGFIARHAGYGWFVRILIELALSAAVVAVWDATHRKPIGRGHPHGVIDV